MPSWVQRPPHLNSSWPKILAFAVAVAVALALLLLYAVTRRHHLPVQAPAPRVSPFLVSTGTIGMAGSLSQSLRRSGVAPLESAQVEKTIKPLVDPRHSKPNDRYEILRSTDGRLSTLTYWPSAFEYFTVARSTWGSWTAVETTIPTAETLVGVSGEIQGSLWEAMIAQGTPPEMIYRFAEIFGWRIDFLTEPRKGDAYKMVWKRHSGNGAIKDGYIVCAYYNHRGKGDLFGLRLAGDYFDQDGNSLRGEFLRAPLAYRRISSRFSEHRFHPILRYYRPHHGIDYSAARGTPAVSIGEGIVTSRGHESGLGNAVRIRHAGSYVSIYGHLMGYAKGIHAGAHVRQGQVVGYVGSSGLSTGPHLHFGFERGGQLINFLSLKMKDNRQSVPLPERSHFDELKKQAAILFSQLARPGAPLQLLDVGTRQTSER